MTQLDSLLYTDVWHLSTFQVAGEKIIKAIHCTLAQRDYYDVLK